MQNAIRTPHQTTAYQAGIFQPIPMIGRYVFFQLAPAADTVSLKASLTRMKSLVDGESVVAGIGQQLADRLGMKVPGLREFPALSGPQDVRVPSTPAALLLWLRGSDMGELVNRTRALANLLRPALDISNIVDSFRHGPLDKTHAHDLTGYEDGTENPEGEEAQAAAFAHGQGPLLDGSSFLAIQQWQHDFEQFESFSASDRDDLMGRRLSDNEELEDAPESAHVKRTAQESFEPEAFVLRRSMPWLHSSKGLDRSGLMFAAFGCSLGAFEVQMRRMAGLEDGIVDGLFRFSQPLTGSYLWCPPMHNGQLQLGQLGL
ncbi:Dyp-type peroxidase [Diaphorobacter ruginosibacter]|uniref:Dyp-type peroxidase n=1 Tax=Diaphorobacter ruginosibacter TaxID=1715720 RepID=UPI0033428846